MTTSKLSPSLQLSSQVVLAKISALVEIAPVLRELVENCSLNSADFCDYSSLRCLFGKTYQGRLVLEADKTLKKSLVLLHNWGIWGLITVPVVPKLNQESEFSVWVYTGDIRIASVESQSLQQMLGEGNSLVIRAAGGDRIYSLRAPTLRSLAKTGQKQAGSGALKICDRKGNLSPVPATIVEKLMGWSENSTQFGIDATGKRVEISQSQRVKMLGNGVIPGEITRILEGCKGILQSI
jgi:hypothetical protein